MVDRIDNYIGVTVRGYELRELIGQGSFGAVYRAFQTLVGREVAVKVILPEYANKTDFIRRFEYEAQIIAQLENLHIVPLYDYWREPSGAYLVMRYLRGGSLRDLIRDSGALEPDLIARVMDQIASALTVAHRNNVIHRDIKPDNILLDEDDNAYLADFGIAKNQVSAENGREPEAVAGSPAYIAPEQINGTTIDPKTDVYALGIVLYEMLTGETPFAGTSTYVDLLNMQLNVPVPYLVAGKYNSDITRSLNNVIQKATAKNPGERYSDAGSLAKATRDALDLEGKTSLNGYNTSELDLILIPFDDEGEVTAPNPYKGLRAFQQSDSSDFFGREALTKTLVSRLTADNTDYRFLAVIGPSGSGKSSVVRAGLIPALRGGALPGSGNWFYKEVIPGTRPLDEISEALVQVALNPVTPETLALVGTDLVKAVNQVLPPDNSELVIVIDQFEEIFTLLENEDQRGQIMDLIMSAISDPNSRVRIVITMRADFYDRPLLYPRFGDLIKRRTEIVLPLSVEELRRAIVSPAENVGVYPDDDLVTAIVEDVGEQPGALPLLQYALTELYERRVGRRMVKSAYLESGGVLGSLARRADELYQELDTPAKEITRQLFLRLVTLGEGTEDTRRRVQRSELLSLTPDLAVLDKVLDSFGKYRLLTFDRDPTTRDTTVEVAHEALIRTWTRLREWLSASREDLRTQRRLMSSAGDWLTAKKDDSYLADGSRLTQFENLRNEGAVALNRDEAEYLDASLRHRAERLEQEEKRRQRELDLARESADKSQKLAEAARVNELREKRNARRLRRGVYLLFIMLFAAVGAMIYGFNQAVIASNAQASAEQSLARSETLRLATESSRLLGSGSNAELAALLALHSIRGQYSTQGDAALTETSSFAFAERLIEGHDNSITSTVYSGDGRYLLTGSSDKTAKLWDARTGTLVRTFSGHTDTIINVAFSPDSRQVATGSFDKSVRIWETETGKQIHELRGTEFRVRSLAWSPDGQYVAAGTGDWTIWMWNASTGALVRQFDKIHGDFIIGIAFSPDSKTIVTGSGDNTAKLWDVETGEVLRTLGIAGNADTRNGHTNFIKSVQFSPDGKYVLTGSLDRTARLWESATGNQIVQFNGHTDEVYSAVFSSNGAQVLTASADRTARLWTYKIDSSQGEEIDRFANHTRAVQAATFAPDSVHIATVSDDRTIRLWNVNAQRSTQSFTGHTGAIIAVAYSPDGKFFFTGSTDKTGILWDVATDKQIYTFTRHRETSGAIVSAAFSPDGKFILTGGDDKIGWLLNATTGNAIQSFTDFDDWVGQVGFSRDGKQLIFACKDGTVQVYDAQTYKLIIKLDVGSKAEKRYGVYGVVFTPDGKRAITGDENGGVIEWDLTTGQQVGQFVGHTGSLYRIAISPDGKSLLTSAADGTVRAWDLATREQRFLLEGHAGGAPIAYSPDGQLILTGGYQGAAALWQASDGRSVRPIYGNLGGVAAVTFSPDSRFVLTGSNDSTARLQPTDYLALAQAVCDRVLRDFTPEERTAYTILDQNPTCPKFEEQGSAAQPSTGP